jgi:hypothetical protein
MNAAVVDLFDGVDDLIRRVAHTDSPEIRKVRARVHTALVAARNAFDNIAKAAPAPSRLQLAVEQAAVTGSDASCGPADLPQTLGVALLFGLGLGLMADSRR